MLSDSRGPDPGRLSPCLQGQTQLPRRAGGAPQSRDAAANGLQAGLPWRAASARCGPPEGTVSSPEPRRGSLTAGPFLHAWQWLPSALPRAAWPRRHPPAARGPPPHARWRPHIPASPRHAGSFPERFPWQELPPFRRHIPSGLNCV